MTRAHGERGRVLVGLLFVNLGLLGVLTLLLVGNRAAEKALRASLAGKEKECAAHVARQEEMAEEAVRFRLEVADLTEAKGIAETRLAEAGEKLAAAEKDLARVRAERDDHLDARLAAERRLADALDLLASRGK